MCAREQNGARAAEDPRRYSGITPGERGERGLKKQQDGGDFKVAKCAGPRLNDGWRIVLISVPPRRTCKREGVTLPLILVR